MLENDLYREILLDRLANPVNQGQLSNPDIQSRLVNPLCGDSILLQIKTKDKVIEQAVYSGNGCAVSQVAASFLAENIEGKTLEEAKQIKDSDILKWLDINPGPNRLKCALLSLQVLKEITND